MRPDDRKYTETHEWIKINAAKKEASIGITDYAVEQLSDLVHIDLPKVGASVESGSPFGEIESVKTVADLVSPVNGKVLEVNNAIVDKLDTLKESPFENGWLIKVKLADNPELKDILSQKEYAAFLESEHGDDEDEEKDEDDVDEDDMV